jgi:hypothetical protein
MQECGQNGGMGKSLLPNRLHQTYLKAKRKLGKGWIWFMAFLLERLVEDRLVTLANSVIDSGVAVMWTWSAGFLLVFMQSPVGVVGTLLAVVIVAIVAHSYIETWTHPERMEIPDSDAKVEALTQRVEDIESLMSSEQRKAVAIELSKHSPDGEVVVASDMTAVSKTHNIEIRSTLGDAGWKAKALYLDEGEVPDGITVSGAASGLVLDAFKQADLDMKEDPNKKTGPTYILIGPIEVKKKNKQ